MEILNHRLEDCGVVHLACVKNTRELVGPEMIVLHYTAGVNCMSSAIYLTRPDVDASAHLVIGRKGELIQLVSFNIEAWHAGRSSYAGKCGLNRCSIGIELDNLGKLHLEGNKFVAECGQEVPYREVFVDCSEKVPTFWHKYTERQVGVLREVCRLLGACYPIRYVVGHSDVTTRKVDPGPALKFMGFKDFRF